MTGELQFLGAGNCHSPSQEQEFIRHNGLYGWALDVLHGQREKGLFHQLIRFYLRVLEQCFLVGFLAPSQAKV